MFDTVCTLPLSSELFAQALHPSEPVVAVGLSAGHVQSFRLPSTDEDLNGHEGASNGYGNIVTQWRTRRHKGSCRSLVFSVDGEGSYSTLNVPLPDVSFYYANSWIVFGGFGMSL